LSAARSSSSRRRSSWPVAPPCGHADRRHGVRSPARRPRPARRAQVHKAPSRRQAAGASASSAATAVARLRATAGRSRWCRPDAGSTPVYRFALRPHRLDIRSTSSKTTRPRPSCRDAGARARAGHTQRHYVGHYNQPAFAYLRAHASPCAGRAAVTVTPRKKAIVRRGPHGRRSGP